MLVQDTLTGALHEVPEYGEAPDFGYYGEAIDPLGEVYDGFGNPVGFLPFLAPLANMIAPLAAKVLPSVAQAIPGVGNLLGKILPGAGGGAPSLPGLPP